MQTIRSKFTVLRNTILQNRHQFSTASSVNNIFKIQSTDDFNVKVKQSDKPVIVDFFAT